MILIVGFLFLMGVVFGSFLNVVIFRTTHGTSPLSGRSMCPKCKKQISWKYNIPLISFFWLGGRCADCGKKISWQYPVVEFLTGIVFVWWYVMGSGFFLLVEKPWVMIQPLFWLLVAMGLLVVLVADWRYGIIPDSVNLFLTMVSVGYRVALLLGGKMEGVDFVRAILSGLVLAFFFWMLWLLTKGRGFGFGDVKLAPSLGLILGWPRVIPGVFLAFVIGAVVSIILIVFGKKKFKQTIAFGPFLVVGTVIALIFGSNIWGWYLGQM
jgi:prepilin signal peptidase PulO-like enzyme (type II secretory pathway)